MSSAVAVSGERFRQAANRLQLWMWLRCECRPELARGHVLDHALAERTDGGIGAHGELLLSEVANTSILRTGLPTPLSSPLNWLPTSRPRIPRSGYRGSDLVHWHQAPLRLLVDLMPGIGGGADPDRRSQKFGAKAVLDPERSLMITSIWGP